MHKTKRQWPRIISMTFSASFLIVLPACRPSSPPPGSDASALLQEIAEETWSYALERSPTLRRYEGLPVEKLWDVSYEGAREDAEHSRDVLDRLARLDPDELDPDEVLTYEILEWQAQLDLQGMDFFWHTNVVTPYAALGRNLASLFGALPVASEEDRERYVALVGQVGAYVDALHERVLGQVERGIAVSRQAMPGVLGFIGSFVRPPATSLYHVADERFAGAGVDDETIAAFRQQVAEIVEQQINPAWQRLLDYLTGDYQELAPDGVGVKQYPSGEAYYRYLVRAATTYDVSPEEVQRVGYEMVAEMEEAMAAIQREVGFAGSPAEFRRHLQTDPRYFPTSPEEVAERIHSAADAFYAKIGDYFLATPRAPYDVRRLDPRLEATMTYGYYEPPSPSEPTGVYFFNGSNLDQRSRLPLAGLAFHELVPGHHFHFARQMENKDLPDLRRYLYPTAFTEGWGSYSTFLGLEAGLASDPYSRYGIYMLEIFLANRLVVDPGMNYFGWPLEKAREYMGEHSLESATQIATETLRYSTDIPGQAVAYQMGKRKILDLRRRAGEALGERFDIRQFHETVLGSGAMPLAVLEKHVDAWIERTLAGTG